MRLVPSYEFRSTPPQGGRRRAGSRRRRPGSCFDPRPRKEGDLRADRPSLRELPVSIHAPRKEGDQANPIRARPDRGVSIHAPARRATTLVGKSAPASAEFRSTPPQGGRHQLRSWRAHPHRVSIHAPARRATPAGRTTVTREQYVSIHAPARRATRSGGRTRWRNRCFDPRPRKEGDIISLTASACRP